MTDMTSAQLVTKDMVKISVLLRMTALGSQGNA